MKMMKMVAAFSAMALVAGVMAQGFPGGGGFGGGQGRGGMRMMGMGGGMMPPAFLLMRPDVQEDLKVTDEQKGKLQEAQQQQQQEMMDAFQGMRGGGGGGDREAMMAEMRKTMEKMMETASKRINTILDAGQQKRLREIQVQLAGNRAVLDAGVAKELVITDAQKKSIDELNTKMQAANRSVMERARNQEIEWAQVGEITQRNNKAMDDELGKIMTQAQKDKLKAMQGAKFTEKLEGQGG